MRVLVVEDEVRMANVIKRSLTREGLAVDVAPDGEQAIWMATAVDYDASVHSGADDYLVKPFTLAELHARLRSLVRRGWPPRLTVLCVGDLRLDPARREVHRREVRIERAAKEFALLDALMRRPGEVLTHLELIEQAWDFAHETRSNVIDVYSRRLRRKLDEPFGKSSLETVRGAGYRLRDR